MSKKDIVIGGKYVYDQAAANASGTAPRSCFDYDQLEVTVLHSEEHKGMWVFTVSGLEKDGQPLCQYVGDEYLTEV